MTVDNVNEREMQFEFLGGLRERWAAYHNHKENLAWAAVVSYIALAGGAIGVSDEVVSPPIRIVMAIGIVLAALLVQIFVRRQRNLRDVAVATEAACDRLMLMMAAGHMFMDTDWRIAETVIELKSTHNSFRTPSVLVRAMMEITSRRDINLTGPTFNLVPWFVWPAAVTAVLFLLPCRWICGLLAAC